MGRDRTPSNPAVSPSVVKLAQAPKLPPIELKFSLRISSNDAIVPSRQSFAGYTIWANLPSVIAGWAESSAKRILRNEPYSLGRPFVLYYLAAKGIPEAVVDAVCQEWKADRKVVGPEPGTVDVPVYFQSNGYTGKYFEYLLRRLTAKKFGLKPGSAWRFFYAAGRDAFALANGTKLPSINELAQFAGVSRDTARRWRDHKDFKAIRDQMRDTAQRDK